MLEHDHDGSEIIKLSVVIRCRNEAKVLRTTLSALRAQKCDFPWEIVVVDNASEDNSVAVSEEFCARVVHLPKDEFTPGRASNLGIANAKGEIILMLSAHSVPFGLHFLEDCIVSFEDPTIVAARTIPSDDKLHMSQWYEARDIQFQTAEEQAEFEQQPRWIKYYMSAACGLLRRSIWEKLPFDETLDGNEDKIWISNILKQGYKIRVCVPATSLYLKERTKQERAQKKYRQEVTLYRVTGHSKVSVKSFLRGLAGVIIRMPIYPFWNLRSYLSEQIPYLLIPLRAKQPLKAGSLSSYDRFD